MSRPRKIGNPLGVADWQALDSLGDVKRLLRWLILSVRDGTMDKSIAATLGQLSCYLMKAMETGDLEKRINEIEARLAAERSATEQPHEHTHSPYQH
ncbi:MAG: hypothetical protein AB7P18_05615 [Candidatus Binatia bacterium]